MDIKRRKPKKLTRYEQWIKRLERDLKQAQNDAVPDDLLVALELAPDKKRHKYDPMQTKIEIKKEINQRILAARSKIVKKAVADANKFIGYIQKERKQEWEYSGKRYPKQWMLKDPKINAVIERRPIVLKFLNFLFEYTRHISKKKREQMIELTNQITGGKKHNDKHPYTVFIADADFWNEAATELKCAEITVKDLLRKFCEVGIVKELGSVATHKRGGQPGLYADGYLVEDWEAPVKHPFLTEKKKEALLSLSKKKLAGIQYTRILNKLKKYIE